MSKGWPACLTNNNLTLATPQACLVAFWTDLFHCPVGILETDLLITHSALYRAVGDDCSVVGAGFHCIGCLVPLINGQHHGWVPQCRRSRSYSHKVRMPCFACMLALHSRPWRPANLNVSRILSLFVPGPSETFCALHSLSTTPATLGCWFPNPETWWCSTWREYVVGSKKKMRR
jgi:hypothetical protein